MNFLFDLYGTLIDIWTDEERWELWLGVCDLLGESDAGLVKEEYKALCRRLCDEMIAENRTAHPEREERYIEIDLSRVFREMLTKRGMDGARAGEMAEEFRRLSMVRIRPFRGVKTMLKRLRKSGRVYLVSNAQSCFTIPELKATGLIDMFDGILISSDAGVKKPSGEIFSIAFQKFGIKAEESIYVGNDMRDDILGASRAGLRSVYIETLQSGKYPSLDLPEPTYRVRNHREMSELLCSLCEKAESGS